MIGRRCDNAIYQAAVGAPLEARTERSEATKLSENVRSTCRNLSGSASPDRPLGDSLLRKVRALEGRSYSGFVEKCVSTELREANPIFQGPFATRFS